MNPKQIPALFAFLSAFCPHATAQILTLDLDPASTGPRKCAVEEIRREVAARGMTVLSADVRAPADAIRITLAIGALTGIEVVAQMPEKFKELEAAWQCQTDSVTELARKTPTGQLQPKAAKGQAKRQPQAQ